MKKNTRTYGINPLDYHHYNPTVDFDSIREQKENLEYVDDSELIEGSGVTSKKGEVSTPRIYGTFSSNRIQKESIGLEDNFEIVEGGGVEPNGEQPAKDNILTFTANTAGSTIRLYKVRTPNTVSLSTSTDGGKTWTEYTIDDTITLVNGGDSVKFKATTTNVSFYKDGSNFYSFGMTGSVAASGDVTSLLNGTGGDVALSSSYCFYALFANCTVLTTAPALPSTTLTPYCYNRMFERCTSLTTAPALPATTLANNCYDSMFEDCTALTTAPVLPATTLKKGCYTDMFDGCTSLTTAPVLPATTLTQECYRNMFHDCVRLNYIKAMFTTTPTSTYTGSWVNGVANSGTFVKNVSASWDVTGSNGVPSGWTVETASE